MADDKQAITDYCSSCGINQSKHSTLNRDIAALRNINSQISARNASLRASLSPSQRELSEYVSAFEQRCKGTETSLQNTVQELLIERDNVKRVEGWLAYEKRAYQNEMRAHSHTQAINMELVHYLNRLPVSAHTEESNFGNMQSEIAQLKLEANGRCQESYRQQEQLNQCASDNAELRAAFNAKDAEVITRRVEGEMLRKETERLRILCDDRAQEIAQQRIENERLKTEIDCIEEMSECSSMKSFIMKSPSIGSSSEGVTPIDSDPDFTIDDDEVAELGSS